MPGEPVLLFQYDLSNGMAQSLGPMLIGRALEGIWHTSIVAYGVEIWFGQGIHCKAPPGTTHHGAPRKKIRLGETQLDKDTFFEYIEGMRETYRADRYHLLEFNCNHFSNDVIGFLNGGSIPREILDQPKELMATPFGQQMRPMIEQMFVGANNRSAGDAVNNIVPSLANGSTPSRSTQSIDDVPSAQSIQSNLQIVTSIASLRSTLERSKATAIMYTSASCPPCTAIKPHFEELARTHHRITFCLVETGLGEGGQVAKLSEFGGPVSATPTFVFFKGAEKVGECKGADRREVETQIGMLALEAFPPHPHEKLSLPALSKLTKTLSPVTFSSFPPLPALSAKLATSTASLDASVSSVLTKQVIPYLSALPTPPAKSSSPFPSTLLDPWLSSTLTALSTLSDPASKFPVLDLIRLALARDHTRLSTQPAFLSFLPKLLSQLVLDLDIDSPSHAYLLTSLRLFSNALLSPILTSRLLAPDCLPNLTKLLIRALLDTEEKMRSAGAGLGWSVIAKVYERRIAGEGEGEGEASGVGEEWEVEVAGAVLEALGREETSLEVVHRLTATLGLLLYRSPFSEELKSFLEVLEGRGTLETKEKAIGPLPLETKEKAIEGMKGEEKDKKEVNGLIVDVKKLMG